MGNFLIANNFAFSWLGYPLIRNSFFVDENGAFGLKTAFYAFFGPLCSWLVLAYFWAPFDPKTPEVRFVHAVTAGGSVKFFPAV